MLFFSSPTISRNVRFVFSNIIWICVASYFAYHMLTGARGALSWAVLTGEVENLEKELSELKVENAFLENKINGLRKSNLDLDLLEEQAMEILGLTKEGDVVVLLPRD